MLLTNPVTRPRFPFLEVFGTRTSSAVINTMKRPNFVLRWYYYRFIVSRVQSRTPQI